LDDSPYAFRILSQGQSGEVSLTGPADPLTGQQFTRTIRLDYDSPRIRFHTVFANASGHPIEWSVPSVTQYDTADPKNPTHHNKDIWGFSSANPTSAYVNRCHVRFGLRRTPQPKSEKMASCTCIIPTSGRAMAGFEGMAGWPWWTAPVNMP
jgi:hypothetical protein